MQAFPAECRASLHDLGCDVDEELARSKSFRQLETQWSWQAHYLKFCRQHKVPDPCGTGPSYEFLVALYAKTLINGTNIYNSDLMAKTVSFYLHAVNDLFVARGFKEPFAPGELGNKPAAILKNYEAIQGLLRKRNPLTTQMISSMHDYAQVNDRVSFESAIFD